MTQLTKKIGDHMVNAHVGTRIRNLRQQAGVSAREVSRNTGISSTQLYKFEMGKNRISAVHLFKLAHFFNVPPNSFFEGLPGIATGQVTNADISHLMKNFLKIDSPNRGALFKDFVKAVSAAKDSN